MMQPFLFSSLFVNLISVQAEATACSSIRAPSLEFGICLLEFAWMNLPRLMQSVSLYVLPRLVPDSVLRCEYEGFTISHHYGMLVLCNKPTLITY